MAAPKQSKQRYTMVRGLRYNPGISIDWTSEEQSSFNYLIQKYASEIPIVHYANIAQALPEKNIRDIVLHIKLMKDRMNGKRDDVSSTETFSYESLVDDSNTARLIEHNSRVLDQIEANLSSHKIHENTDLLSQARANILAILNELPNTFHDRMPPFPYKLNEELSDSFLPPTSHKKN